MTESKANKKEKTDAEKLHPPTTVVLLVAFAITLKECIGKPESQEKSLD